MTNGFFYAITKLVSYLRKMFHLNDKQSKIIGELIRLLMIPDLSGNCWCLKQMYFLPSDSNPGKFSKITLVYSDKIEGNTLYLKSIDINGNIER